MKRFDFRLRSVLVLRQRSLSEAEQRYTRAIHARRKVEGTIDASWKELEGMNQQMIAIRGAIFSPAQQESFFRAMDNKRKDIIKLEELLKKARFLESTERTKYLAANRDYELLLKLQETQKQKHFHEELLKEQMQQDDLFNARRAVLQAVKTT